MNDIDLVTRIFDLVEKGAVDNAVRSSLRLSRNIGDHMSTAFFLRELIEDRNEIARVIYDDTNHLNTDAQKYVYEQSFERWLKSRTFDYSVAPVEDGDDQKNVLVISVGDFLGEIDQCEKSILDLQIPANLGEYDTAAFTDRYNQIKGELRLRIRAINTLKSRVLNHCLNFAIQVELQIKAQKKTLNFLATSQNEVQNYFKSRSNDVYEKLQKANQLVDSELKEDHSLLLTQVRRAIKAVADHFYPAQNVKTICADGEERILGEEQYLNRLREFVYTKVKRSTSTELLRAELDHLLVFANKLNKIASKGVHTDVSMLEAKQGFLGLYMFLFNLCQYLEAKES